MDFGGLLLLGFLWVVFHLLTKGRQRGDRAPGPPSGVPPAAPPARGDPTQREGSRLEALLREFERALEQGGGSGPVGRPPAPRPAAPPPPAAEEVEERESLETEPLVVSLESIVARPERAQVSQDDGAERLVARRIAAAEARSGAHTRVDHTAFDQRIRQEPADATRVREASLDQLRRAIVWREILGPPLALRDPDGPAR